MFTWKLISDGRGQEASRGLEFAGATFDWAWRKPLRTVARNHAKSHPSFDNVHDFRAKTTEIHAPALRKNEGNLWGYAWEWHEGTYFIPNKNNLQ